MNVAEFEKLPLLGILRGIDEASVEPLTETMISAGLKTVEITMNTAGAQDLIRKMVSCAKGRLTVGAGTVLDIVALKTALSAGATFIVSPVLSGDVANYCAKYRIPAFPGALTPLVVFNAWGAGAAMVKIFPLVPLGPEYLKELKGPFPQIKLLACGGITPENLRSHFDLGASAVGFGTSIFKESWLNAGDYKSIGGEIQRLVRAFHGGEP